MRYLRPIVFCLIFVIGWNNPSLSQESPTTITGVETSAWPGFSLYIHASHIDNLQDKGSIDNLSVTWGSESCEASSSENVRTQQVLLMVDNSSSMRGKFKFVEQGYKIFMDGLRDGSKVSIIRFAGQSENNWNSGLMAQSSSSRYYLKREPIFAELTQKTFLVDGAYQSLSYLELLSTSEQLSIVILSDGLDVGSSIDWNELEQRAKDGGIPLYFIDFSSARERNEKARELAELTHGFYAASADPRELSDIYYRILKRINNQIKIEGVYPNADSRVPPETDIQVSFSAGDQAVDAGRTYDVSPDQQARQHYLGSLKDPERLREPTQTEVERFGLYDESNYYALGLAAIQAKRPDLVEYAILALQKSETVFAAERVALLQIQQAEVNTDPDLVHLYSSYTVRFKGGLFCDEILWKLVDHYQNSGDPEKARQRAEQLVEEYPWSERGDDALMLLAGIERYAADFPKAEELYQDVGKYYVEGDQYGESLYQLSDMYIDQGAPEKAEALLAPLEPRFASMAAGGKLYGQLILAQTLQKKFLASMNTIDQFSQRMPAASELAKARLSQASMLWRNLRQPEAAAALFNDLLGDQSLSEELQAAVDSAYQEFTENMAPVNELFASPPETRCLLSLVDDTILDQTQNFPELFLKHARDSIRQASFAEAMCIVQGVSQEYPYIGAGDRAMYLASIIHHKQDQREARLDTLRSIPINYPASPLSWRAHHLLARQLVEDGNYRDALLRYQAFIGDADHTYAAQDSAITEYDALKAIASVTVSGSIVGDGAALNNIHLVVHDVVTNDIMIDLKSQVNSYEMALPLGHQYTLIASAGGHLPLTVDIDFREVLAPEQRVRDLNLTAIEEGSRVTLQNVMFDLSSSDLREESIPTLDEMVRFLKQNNNLEVEIAGHTDNLGDPIFNEHLSVNRALSVARYLLDNGVSLRTVETNGYADRDPIASNDTRKGRAENRRVELRVIKK